MTNLVPMCEQEYLTFSTEAVPVYAAEKVASGEWSQEESLELARKAFADLLPQGIATKDNYFFTIQDATTTATVGTLWIAAQVRGSKRIAYVYDVRIRSAHQRKGYASQSFLALEDEVRKLGLSGVALHVFGHNVAAQALYVKLGYQPTDINMYKPVRPAGN